MKFLHNIPREVDFSDLKFFRSLDLSIKNFQRVEIWRIHGRFIVHIFRQLVRKNKKCQVKSEEGSHGRRHSNIDAGGGGYLSGIDLVSSNFFQKFLKLLNCEPLRDVLAFFCLVTSLILNSASVGRINQIETRKAGHTQEDGNSIQWSKHEGSREKQRNY